MGLLLAALGWFSGSLQQGTHSRRVAWLRALERCGWAVRWVCCVKGSLVFEAAVGVHTPVLPTPQACTTNPAPPLPLCCAMQIRVHAKHLGHPLFSDDTYSSTAAAGSIVGAGKPARAAAATAAARALGRPALHAKTLGFVHPATGKEMLFDSQLPSDFEAALAALRGPPFAAQDV